MSLRALYVDLNSDVASVEQVLRPHLRGRAVGVVPVMAETTCCIAASVEAKRFGVRTGTPVREARGLCPGIRFVHARPAVYVEFHHRIVAAVESCVPVAAVLSIDEMACELTGSQRQREAAVALAGRIKQAIRGRVGDGLRCSIGVAPNRFLAKTGSDMQKPDGLVVIEAGELPGALFGLRLRELCGVGEAMEGRLRRLGITTVAELCAASPATLARAWGGIEGERMHAKLRGQDVAYPPGCRASVGHSHILAPALRNDEAALAVLYRLLQKAATRLRHYGYWAGGLHLHLSRLGGAPWRDHVAFAPHADTLKFIHTMTGLWRRRPADAAPPLKVGVTLTDLSEERRQGLDLFEADRLREGLNVAIDQINRRFGSQAVYFAGSHPARGAAPMRIAFNHIPELRVESDT